MVTPELLYQYKFFSFLNKSQLKAITKISIEQNYENGQIIYAEGDHADWLYILVKGSIDLFFTIEAPYIREVKKELIFGTVTPGTVFGVTALIEPYRMVCTARATRLSQVIKVDAAGLLAMCNKDEKMAYDFIHQVAMIVMQRVNETRQQLAIARSSITA